MLENYANEINFSLSFYLLLAYIFQTCRIYYQTNRTRNKLSFVPYIIIMAFLVSKIFDEAVKVLAK